MLKKVKLAVGALLAGCLSILAMPQAAQASPTEVSVNLLCKGVDLGEIALHLIGIQFQNDSRAIVRIVAADFDGSQPMLVERPYEFSVKKTQSTMTLEARPGKEDSFRINLQEKNGKITGDYNAILGGEGYKIEKLTCASRQILKFDGVINLGE